MKESIGNKLIVALLGIAFCSFTGCISLPENVAQELNEPEAQQSNHYRLANHQHKEK